MKVLTYTSFVIPKDYRFMTSNTVFIALGIQDKYLEKTTLIRSTLPPGSNKTSLDTSPPRRSLLLHCKQINNAKKRARWSTIKPVGLHACFQL